MLRNLQTIKSGQGQLRGHYERIYGVRSGQRTPTPRGRSSRVDPPTPRRGYFARDTMVRTRASTINRWLRRYTCKIVRESPTTTIFPPTRSYRTVSTRTPNYIPESASALEITIKLRGNARPCKFRATAFPVRVVGHFVNVQEAEKFPSDRPNMH